MSYLGAAESWAKGSGLRVPYAAWTNPDSTEPLRVFAPGFSLTIGVALRLGASPGQGARIIQALAAAVTAATLAWLLDLLAGSLAAAVGVAAILLSPALIGDYIAVLSEPMFLAFVSVALLLMVTRPERPLAYGLAAAAAASVRYAGLSLVVAAVLWALAQNGDRRTRLRRGALAAIPAIAAAFLWLARTYRMTHHAPLPVEHPAMAVGDAVSQAWSELAITLAPSLDDSRWFTAAAVLALVLAVLTLAWNSRAGLGPAERSLHVVLGLFGACYALLVVAAKLFVGHDIPLDLRILSPLVLCAALALVVALRKGMSRWPVPVRAVAAIAAAGWLAGALLAAKELDDDIGVNGYDFATRSWKASETLAWLRREGSGYALYTNHPVPIYYYLHRPSRDLPTIAAPDTLRRFAATLSASPSALVEFSDTTWREQVPGGVLARRLHLRVAARLADGTVWVGPAAISVASSSP
ncbi:MAG: hypothetical protein ACHQU1_04860 [Gemmatimonadales bacterium]